MLDLNKTSYQEKRVKFDNIGIVFLIVFARVRAKAIKCETMAFDTPGKFKLSEFSRQCIHGDLDLRRHRAKEQFPPGGGTEL